MVVLVDAVQDDHEVYPDLVEAVVVEVVDQESPVAVVAVSTMVVPGTVVVVVVAAAAAGGNTYWEEEVPDDDTLALHHRLDSSLLLVEDQVAVVPVECNSDDIHREPCQAGHRTVQNDPVANCIAVVAVAAAVVAADYVEPFASMSAQLVAKLPYLDGDFLVVDLLGCCFRRWRCCTYCDQDLDFATSFLFSFLY